MVPLVQGELLIPVRQLRQEEDIEQLSHKNNYKNLKQRSQKVTILTFTAAKNWLE